ncbi:hypothetical protein V6R21_14975 [Limibacter armeniacum]|uniref:hypothetical protein n=1 Tax=Limibacter armeniacum TaxID=466084 RepID=UPI002FE5F656
MRKLLFFLTALMVASFMTSCDKAEDVFEQFNMTNEATVDGGQVTFSNLTSSYTIAQGYVVITLNSSVDLAAQEIKYPILTITYPESLHKSGQTISLPKLNGSESASALFTTGKELKDSYTVGVDAEGSTGKLVLKTVDETTLSATFEMTAYNSSLEKVEITDGKIGLKRVY